MSLFAASHRRTARRLIHLLQEKGWKITLAESCTGGLVAALLTDIPGASRVLEYGFVTYANEAKQRLIGVRKSLLERHGAVSEPVATAMAQGALKKAGADIAIAITGIAGPGGGSKQKPVGLVFIAIAMAGHSSAMRYAFKGTRSGVRLAAVAAALALAIDAASAP